MYAFGHVNHVYTGFISICCAFTHTAVQKTNSNVLLRFLTRNTSMKIPSSSLFLLLNNREVFSRQNRSHYGKCYELQIDQSYCVIPPEVAMSLRTHLAHWSIFNWIAHSLCTAVKIWSQICGFGSSRKTILLLKKDVKYKQIKSNLVNYTLQGFVKA